MTEITLTEGQQEALDKAIAFCSDEADWLGDSITDENLFAIFGYAGTGKSTLITYLLMLRTS
jgi:ABC-type methionine transport system ATPase subunit